MCLHIYQSLILVFYLIFIGYPYVVSLLAIDANVLRGKFASTNQEELPRSG